MSEAAEKMGLAQFKFTSPGCRGVPDRVFFYKDRAIFIEFKRTGVTKLDPLQKVIKRILESAHMRVYVCNDIAQGKAILKDFKESINNATFL